jgi:superfamily II DNA or RNA helicase
MAQDHVNQRATALDPAEGLSGVGISVMSHLRPQSSATETGVPGLVKAGASSSSLAANQMRIRRPLSTKPQRQSRSIKREDMPSAEATVQDVELPVQSALRSTKIIGTTSSKLSYLLSRIEEFYREEKILVFYDSDNTAYYIAQSLEVLHIDYLIYAKSLAPDMKSDYIVRFNEKPEHRVLLMDIGQAAYGLNISSASRIFFVNPVNRPSIEAQALKRAHRIGQTRAVHAETLILKGTIEEEIFERARKMSRADHQVARELDDDDGIRSIIQSAQPMPTEEANETERIAVIDKTQPLFARPGWAKWKKSALENSSEGGVAASRKRKRKRKRETKDAAEAQIHDRKRLDNKAK